MSVVKQIQVRAIHSSLANAFVKQHHYSGRVVPNSQLHFGAYLDDKLHGVMQFGPSMKKDVTINTVKGTGWNEFIELNRMAFDDTLPKNSESRCIGIALRLIKKHAPHIKWVISFADGTQCGDGTIYRASGFKLINIKKNTTLWRNKETGEQMQAMQFYHTMTKKDDKWEQIPGHMLTYIYLIDKDAQLNKEVLPYSAIDSMGVGMYKGKKTTLAERRAI